MKTPAISSTFILSLAAVAGLVIAHGSLAVRSVRAQGALGSPLPGLSSGQLAHFTSGIDLFDGSFGPLQARRAGGWH
ncbi:MAG TPA: hypothetical protein VKB77_07880 [Terriglobales bacterium]|nr:hypothetical protein [Terriglobales bacterium]